MFIDNNKINANPRVSVSHIKTFVIPKASINIMIPASANN